jgi:hypothetical protein
MSPACDQYIQYLLAGRDGGLTDLDGGYNHGGASFQHYFILPSQPTVLHFLLRAPSGLKLQPQQ